MLDNFEHIKAYWVMLGKHDGANRASFRRKRPRRHDHRRRRTNAQLFADEGEVKMSKAEIITMIENAGFEAVERDTVYNRS